MHFFSGAYGPCFWLDPKEQLIVAVRAQGLGNNLRATFRQFVYGGLVG